MFEYFVLALFSSTLPIASKTYLVDIGLLNFNDFKKIISNQTDMAILVQEILELSVNVVNELNDDFEGDYLIEHDDLEDLDILMESFHKSLK